ncbi:hypothetical protein PILCRDRAFT_826740 [Piloderma croceum F 1598]|uniref:Major facilitator superfamily (MFS) profile domain-containing protein n=1 Tax=Piloderma croceum (strain F 1598) TaxID=765440 RepID=A0A0C3F8E7_PILCF|nr:hypothetical protein PILCRDRAFT_826740 [Piloderma croceum F 1598]
MTGFPLPLADSHSTTQWHGTSKISGPHATRLPIVTIGFLGVSVLWSVEISYASPYLLSLGLSKSYMSLVFLAGPLSGLLVQPVIGALTDASTSRFGRRRPYMIIGSLLCVFALLLFGYTRPVASVFVRFGTSANNVLTIWLAVLSIYCIDFSVNAVMAVDRALMVDVLPSPEQPSATAWAARMVFIGAIAGFFIGILDLPTLPVLSFFGSEQLEVLTVIASFLLFSTHGLTAYFVREKVLLPISSSLSMKSENSIKKQFTELFVNMLTLPRVIRQIFIIQFFAWIGWFPLLFYTSVYIGELHIRSSSPSPSIKQLQLLEAEATRLGTRALLYHSLLALLANFVLPYFIIESAGRVGNTKGVGRFRIHLASLWAASHFLFALCMVATLFVSSVGSATLVVSITGFSWAVSQWAPFSLLAEAILSDPGNTDTDLALEEVGSVPIRVRDSRSWSGARNGEEEQRFLVGADEEEEEEEGEREGEREGGMPDVMGNVGVLSRLDMHTSNLNGDASGRAQHDDVSGGGLSAKAGIILGIHTIFAVIPQFLITGLAAIIFAIFEPNKSNLHSGNALPSPLMNGTSVNEPVVVMKEEGVNSFVVVFQIGGAGAAIACVLCWRLAKELRHR